MKEFDILSVRVVGVAPWGIYVQPEGGSLASPAFIDKFKILQWIEYEEFPSLGSTLLATVIDVDRDPIRMSSLDSDVEVARERASGTL
jgi:hypothetical protein